ncbi:leucine-rich repeat domain-containing protein [Bifidobacterium sp. ESL0728]|uniref:leucine-rich repeat domain-containing protein n=1 Tax=Bifidobacterium sp. ESL0728 TaxID=2983220 RepID=UPI0023F98C54|nr:leucine-rich repeat domain-containing protein [Bifidobacterium sp. ESL0728]WEV58893.1 leucine-rich repeat domain-containing protein [Bifidobacterium sp. ESL0728]
MNEIRGRLSGIKSNIGRVAYLIVSITVAVSMFAAMPINDGQASAVGVGTQDSTCAIGSSTIAQCFPDPNLAAMIAEVTTGSAKNTGDPFTQYKIDNTKRLQYGSGKSITNLSGLQYLTNLIILDLGSNQITDITPIASLVNLQELDLSGNRISDISPLNRLVNSNSPRFGGGGATLKTLDLGSNQISDLSPLELDNTDPMTLSNLSNLDLSQNNVSDVAPLASLYNLENLNLSQNHIANLQPFAKTGNITPLSNTNSLNLSNNDITDPQPLKDLTHGNINLANNNISDCSAFSNKGSGDLNLANNHVSDIRPLHSLISNSVLSGATITLTGNQILDVSSLKDVNDIHSAILTNQRIAFPEKTISASTKTSAQSAVTAASKTSPKSISESMNPHESAVPSSQSESSTESAAPESESSGPNGSNGSGTAYESAASPLLRSAPTSVSLPTAKTKCGNYVAPKNITPSSGVYDPTAGTVTWSNLDTSVRGVSFTFDTTIPCPCYPEVQYNGDVSSLLRVEPASPSPSPEPPSPGPGPTPPTHGPNNPTPPNPNPGTTPPPSQGPMPPASGPSPNQAPGANPSSHHNPATASTPVGGSAPASKQPQTSAPGGAKPKLAETGTPVTAAIFATLASAVSGIGIELSRKSQKD